MYFFLYFLIRLKENFNLQPIRRTSSSPSAISTIFFVESLNDVVRIRFNFNRILCKTAFMEQIELLNCAEGTTVFSTTSGTTPSSTEVSRPTEQSTTSKRY